ncbi:MAG: hypothetical protein MJ074_06735 [Oscillospiraceae bacterium]|nr:hypothetical protein [Oscillospiraceae bacterium]
MIFVKVQDRIIPAEINGRVSDPDWDNRETKSITLDGLSYEAIKAIFTDGVAWSILDVYEEEDEHGEKHEVVNEWDNSEFSISGDITDHRDGRCTIKMGKPTDLEDAYEMIYGGDF